MTNPLTKEQIELLRSLPDDGGLSDPVTIDADWSRLNREGMVWFTRSVKGGSSISRTPAADLLLATIDAERERVLAEVDERVEELAINDATISVFFDGGKAVIGTHETQRPYHEEGSGRTFSAALDACTTRRHRLSNPQGETDQ